MRSSKRIWLLAAVWLLVITACSSLGALGLSGMSSPAARQWTEAPGPAENLALQPVAALDMITGSPAQSHVALDLEQKLIALYRRAHPAVVYIEVPPLGSGSGFVYSEDGHIVTNHHVIAQGERFEIFFARGERRVATLVGSDPDSDLALLKVDDLPEGVAPLPLADPASVRVGQFVVAIGNPFGEQGSMSFGIISAVGRSLRSQREMAGYQLPDVLQTDAPINPGNSGGPLLNLKGEVVGVNSAIATGTGTNSGVGFSIPVQAVWRIVPSLLETGRHGYAYMGVSFERTLSLIEMEAYGRPEIPGTYVARVLADSPAAEAGLRAANPHTGAQGDLIVAIDGRLVRDFGDLNSYLVFHTRPGQTIELTVWRGGREVMIPLTLGERP
jgi:2-alkenal reductase